MKDYLVHLRNLAVAAWKWSLSFTKSDWSFEDYPIAIRRFEYAAHETSSRLKPVAVSASVVNWWALSGSGDTREAAISDLEANFLRQVEARRDEGRQIPRPGSHVPLEFASTENVDAHNELADDFISRVLDIDWAFISDESSLWDFHDEDTNDRLYKKIREVYGVDVSDIRSARLYEIFDRIKTKRNW